MAAGLVEQAVWCQGGFHGVSGFDRICMAAVLNARCFAAIDRRDACPRHYSLVMNSSRFIRTRAVAVQAASCGSCSLSYCAALRSTACASFGSV